MRIQELGRSGAVKKVIEALNETELKKLEALIARAIHAKVRVTTRELDQENNKLREVKQTENYYKGFYWAINGEIEWYNLSSGHIDGINEGLKFLKEKPDQVVQHYGDPNPKTKVVQHLKDSQTIKEYIRGQNER